MKPVRFKASLGSIVTIVTFATCIFIPALTVFIIYSKELLLSIPAIFTCVVLFITYGLHPLYYEISDTTLAIKCPFYTYTFPKDEIQSVTSIGKGELGFTIRAFGSGGFFGVFGIFYNKTYKWMAWFGTDWDNYILVERNKGRKLIHTPDDTQAFIDALKQKSRLN